jgi:hypothetical protein
MNRLPDVELVLRDYLADTGDRAPDRVLDDVAARIARQPRRPALRLPWRPFMNTYAKLGLAGAAIVIVAVIGYSLLPRQPSVGGPTPSPITAPTPTSSDSAQALPEGTLSGGRYIFGPFGRSGLTITAEVPAGWNGHPDRVVTGPGDDAPVDIAVAFLVADGLHGDPCHWDRLGNGHRDQPGNVPAGPGAVDLVNALQASTAFTTTTSTLGPATDGYRPTVLGIKIPDTVNLAECDGDIVGGSHYYMVFSGPGANPLFQGYGKLMDLWIVEVDGTRLIAMIRYSDDTPELDAARAILESLRFRP